MKSHTSTFKQLLQKAKHSVDFPSKRLYLLEEWYLLATKFLPFSSLNSATLA